MKNGESKVASNGDDLSSMQTVVSPREIHSKDDLNAITPSWIEQHEGMIKDADTNCFYDWDDDVEGLESQVHNHGKDFDSPQVSLEYDIDKPSTAMKEPIQRSVSWMSPIKTVKSIDSATRFLNEEQPRKGISMQATSPKRSEKIELIDNMKTCIKHSLSRPDIEVQKTSIIPSKDATLKLGPSNVKSSLTQSTVTAAEVEKASIWRRDPSKSIGLKLRTDNDGYLTDDEDDLLCITFTPSEDVDDLSRCDSPVAIDPDDLERGDLKQCNFSSLIPPIKCSMMKLDRKVPTTNMLSTFSKLLTTLLAVTCITGKASRVLNRYDIPEAVVSFVYTPKNFESTRTLRRRYKQGKPDVFNSPGKFLDIRQNSVGVWLK